MLLALLLAAVEDLSTIAVPIRTTLAPLLPQIEAQVPKTLSRTVREKRYTVAYDVRRDPVALRMSGTTLRASTTAHYALKACPNRFPCVSCGIDQPRRQAIITLNTRFGWDPSWRLRSTTAAEPARFPNRCRVTALNLDVTNRFIAPVINRQLRDVATAIDRNTPGLTDLRPLAHQIWTSLQAPFEIAPRTWLRFEPRDVALGSIRGDGLLVESTLALTARTHVLVGEKPAAAPKGLPPLRMAEGRGGLHVPFEVTLPYDEASRLATEQFGHRTHKAGSADVRVEAIRVRPATGGKIAIETVIDYRGGGARRYAGPVVLEGTPRIDARTGSVVVPDLDYRLEKGGRSLFMRVAERIAHVTLRARLRDSARWPLAPHAQKVQQEVSRALVRQLAPGVLLRGSVAGVQPRGVAARPSAIVVSVVLTGQAAVEIAPPP